MTVPDSIAPNGVKRDIVYPKRLPNIPPVPIPNVAIFDVMSIMKLSHVDSSTVLDIQNVHFAFPYSTILRDERGLACITCHGTEMGLRSFMERAKGKKNFSASMLSRLEGTTFRNARLTISISKATSEELETFYGLNSNRIRVIPNGIDLSEFDNVNSYEVRRALGSEPVILYVGGYSLRKGLLNLLKALESLKERSWRLVLVGGGPQSSKVFFYSLIEKYGLRNRIMRVVNLPREQLLATFAAADIYVHPALYEPQGISVLEAMASGKAIIAGRTGGIPETLSDSGLIVDPEDYRAIARSIALILDDAQLRNALGRKAKMRASLFDWSIIANKYSEQVLGSSLT
jgi:glycosyltransferase involved in cell wall biosynthesis